MLRGWSYTTPRNVGLCHPQKRKQKRDSRAEETEPGSAWKCTVKTQETTLTSCRNKIPDGNGWAPQRSPEGLERFILCVFFTPGKARAWATWDHFEVSPDGRLGTDLQQLLPTYIFLWFLTSLHHFLMLTQVPATKHVPNTGPWPVWHFCCYLLLIL